MEELFIKIDNANNPIGHPLLKSNLIHIFDEDIPSEFVPFVKADPMTIDIFEIDLGNRYVFDDGEVKEVRNIRSMTEEEKNSKIESMKEEFYTVTGFRSWDYSIEHKVMTAPKPRPEDSVYNIYVWNEEILDWEKVNDDRFAGKSN